MQASKPNAPGLLRQLGFFSATALVISNMVGTGIFAYTGYMAGQLGRPSVLLECWAVGAVFALAGALSYSELGVNFPSSGGEYVYLTHAFGPEWGFMTGWVSFFAGFSAPIAAAALAFSDYLGYFFPGLKQANASLVIGSGAFQLRLGRGQMMASLLIAAFTILNCMGVGRTAKVQNVLTSTKLIVIAGFVLLGFAAGTGSWSHFSENAIRTSTLTLPTQFVVSLLWVMVAYSGWNAATYVAEEVRRPERTLPAALAAGTAIVAVLYLGLNLVADLLHAAGGHEERDRGGLAGGVEPVRTGRGRRLRGADGDLDHVHRERDGYHRTARVLCDGEESRVLRSGRQGASAMAHTGGGDREPGLVRDGDDDHTVPRPGDLHRDEPHVVYGALGGVAADFPAQAAGVAAAAGRGFRVSADSCAIHTGGRVHDGVRRGVESDRIFYGLRHRGGGRAGVSFLDQVR